MTAANENRVSWRPPLTILKSFCWIWGFLIWMVWKLFTSSFLVQYADYCNQRTSEDTDKIDALDAGADDYLTKPFSVEELLARLRVTQRRLATLQIGSANADAVFTNGKLKVDYAAGCAFLDGQELHLTPSEYKLLCLLCKNVGKVLTHTFITQQIWEEVGKTMLPHCAYLWLLCVKNWKKSRVPTIYPNSYRSRVPHDAGRAIRKANSYRNWKQTCWRT